MTENYKCFSLRILRPSRRNAFKAVGLHKERCRHFRQNAGNAIAYDGLHKTQKQTYREKALCPQMDANERK